MNLRVLRWTGPAAEPAKAGRQRARFLCPAERRPAVRGLGTRIVEMPLNGGKAPAWALRYFLGRNALPMIAESKCPVSPVIAKR